jgi:hypothetical protein
MRDDVVHSYLHDKTQIRQLFVHVHAIEEFSVSKWTMHERPNGRH